MAGTKYSHKDLRICPIWKKLDIYMIHVRVGLLRVFSALELGRFGTPQVLLDRVLGYFEPSRDQLDVIPLLT